MLRAILGCEAESSSKQNTTSKSVVPSLNCRVWVLISVIAKESFLKSDIAWGINLVFISHRLYGCDCEKKIFFVFKLFLIAHLKKCFAERFVSTPHKWRKFSDLNITSDLFPSYNIRNVFPTSSLWYSLAIAWSLSIIFTAFLQCFKIKPPWYKKREQRNFALLDHRQLAGAIRPAAVYEIHPVLVPTYPIDGSQVLQDLLQSYVLVVRHRYASVNIL